ncbi:hypothetical protein ROHU_028828 [Labeo rohita]|uniref:Uncharacterized protein n=1 Tax=Labeo rohita TaxID=84645 RepID=A0A498M0Y6_LABRO|nr:hypothetical protein ROHU_028828 [Labeo rohita]
MEEIVPKPAPERAVTVSAPAPESAPVSALAPVPSLVLASAFEEVSKSMSKPDPVILKDTPEPNLFPRVFLSVPLILLLSLSPVGRPDQ